MKKAPDLNKDANEKLKLPALASEVRRSIVRNSKQAPLRP